MTPTIEKRTSSGCAQSAPGYIPDDPLLTAREAAAERRQGLSTFWRDVAAGRVPPAYYVGPKTPRWRRSELRTAIEATRAVSAK